MDLVTGASGFIGAAVARALVRQGRDVCVLGRRPCGIAGLAREQLADLSEPERLRDTLDSIRPQRVFHLTAYGVTPADRDPKLMRQINTDLPATLMQLLADSSPAAIVCVGSSAEYAPLALERALAEQDPLEAEKLYGASKAAGSLLAAAIAQTAQLPFAYLRLFQIYGPGEAPHRLLSALCSRLLAGETVPLSVGSQVRDFLHIDDAVAALLLAGEQLAQGELRSGFYNVGTGIGTSVKDFSLAAARAMGADREQLAFGALPQRPDDLPYVVADVHAFAAATGWQPRYGLADGLAGSIDALTAAHRDRT